MFFFSSRRRHTRCSRDWSSDVCSSDLKIHDVCRGRILRDNRYLASRTGQGRDYGKRKSRVAGIQRQIGRASCRERGEITDVAVAVEKKDGTRCIKSQKVTRGGMR